MRVEINELENRKKVEKIKETKNWFFEKISKIGRLTQKKRGLKLLESEITEGPLLLGLQKWKGL